MWPYVKIIYTSNDRSESSVSLEFILFQPGCLYLQWEGSITYTRRAFKEPYLCLSSHPTNSICIQYTLPLVLTVFQSTPQCFYIFFLMLFSFLWGQPVVSFISVCYEIQLGATWNLLESGNPSLCTSHVRSDYCQSYFKTLWCKLEKNRPAEMYKVYVIFYSKQTKKKMKNPSKWPLCYFKGKLKTW